MNIFLTIFLLFANVITALPAPTTDLEVFSTDSTRSLEARDARCYIHLTFTDMDECRADEDNPNPRCMQGAPVFQRTIKGAAIGGLK